MQLQYPIRAESNFCEQARLFSYESEENEASDLKIIDGFLISPNSKFMAIFLGQYLDGLYQLQVIELLNSKLLFEFRFVKDYNDQNFFQFSFDSKYLAYHSTLEQVLYILSLNTWTQQCVGQIEYVYKLDDKNQIFVQKNKQIQIYSIEQNSLKQFIEKIRYDVRLTFNLELRFGIGMHILLIQYNNALDLFYARPSFNQLYYQETNDKQVFITESKLLIIQYKKFQDRIIQLRNLRNGRILRYAQSKSKPNRNLVQDNYFFYVSEFNGKPQVYNRFNFILGENKEMIIKVPDPQDNVYITNSILIDIDKESSTLRHFILDN